MVVKHKYIASYKLIELFDTKHYKFELKTTKYLDTY